MRQLTSSVQLAPEHSVLTAEAEGPKEEAQNEAHIPAQEPLGRDAPPVFALGSSIALARAERDAENSLALRFD